MMHLNTLRDYISRKDWQALEQFIAQQPMQRMADSANALHIHEQMQLLTHLAQAGRLFEHLSPATQLQLAQHLSIEHIAALMMQMHSDDRTDFYQCLVPKVQQQLLQALPKTMTQQLCQLAAYAQNSAGAIMSSDFVTLDPQSSLADAIETLRHLAWDRETLYLVYVVDDAQRLIGVISLRQIIQADPQCRVAQVMQRELITAYVDDDQEHVASVLAHYDFLALPIIDTQQRLVGIVTYDDAMDVIRAETDEDFLKGSAVQTQGSLSLKQASIFSLYKKRVFWLVILVFGSLLSGMGIAHFEDIIATHIVLVFFLPLLVGSGGNAGSQSATLMVRALATGDVELKDWLGLLGRETLVALCLGITMAVAVSILGYIRGDIMVAVVLALSMLGIVLLGALIGMSLPFVLNRLKLDPASASGPLVTSICDATGVVVYLFIASRLLF